MKKVKAVGLGVVATGLSAVVVGIPGLVICGGIGVGALLLGAAKILKK